MIKMGSRNLGIERSCTFGVPERIQEHGGSLLVERG